MQTPLCLAGMEECRPTSKIERVYILSVGKLLMSACAPLPLFRWREFITIVVYGQKECIKPLGFFVEIKTFT